MSDTTNQIICRLCAETKSSRNIIKYGTRKFKELQITKKIEKLCINLEENDTLPKSICKLCSLELDRTYEFTLKVETAQIKLKNFNFEVKAEKISDDEDNNVTTFKQEIDVEFDKNDFSSEDELPIINIEKKRCRKIVLVNNYEIHDNWSSYKWTCARCRTQFNDVQSLRTHYTTEHYRCSKFKCIDCTRKPFTDIRKFLSHIRTHQKNLSLTCFFCNIKLETLKGLIEHEKGHSFPLSCNSCLMVFNNNDELNAHISLDETKKPPVVLNLKCPSCQKEFKSKSNLKIHMAIHTGRSRNYTCHLCGKTFFNKGGLEAHLDSHEDRRRVQCKICHHGFRTNSQLRAHVTIHGNVKPFTCDQCGRSFRLKTHLNNHMIVHTDNMPFQCTYCGKHFRFKTILTQHLRQHTGDKPYSCNLCNREFTNWPNFNKHMKRRHGIDTAKKKHTPDGVFPVNPNTGELQYHNVTEESEVWKKDVLREKRPGRPTTQKTEVKTEIQNNQMESQMQQNLDLKSHLDLKQEYM